MPNAEKARPSRRSLSLRFAPHAIQAFTAFRPVNNTVWVCCLYSGNAAAWSSLPLLRLFNDYFLCSFRITVQTLSRWVVKYVPAEWEPDCAGACLRNLCSMLFCVYVVIMYIRLERKQVAQAGKRWASRLKRACLNCGIRSLMTKKTSFQHVLWTVSISSLFGSLMVMYGMFRVFCLSLHAARIKMYFIFCSYWT